MCQRVVEGRVPELIRDLGTVPKEQLPEIPFRIGAHLSTPIVLADQRVYGTLCCFSAAPRADLVQADLDKLKMCATLVARKVELNAARGVDEPPPDWKLEPKAEYDAAGWRQASPRASLSLESSEILSAPWASAWSVAPLWMTLSMYEPANLSRSRE